MAQKCNPCRRKQALKIKIPTTSQHLPHEKPARGASDSIFLPIFLPKFFIYINNFSKFA